MAGVSIMLRYCVRCNKWFSADPPKGKKNKILTYRETISEEITECSVFSLCPLCMDEFDLFLKGDK